MSFDTRPLLVLAGSALIASMLGCGGGDQPSEGKPSSATTQPAAAAPAEPAPAAAAPAGGDSPAVREANQVFTLRCVTCHGEQGAGDGPGSANLAPKPRNFQDPAWQASVSDEHLSAIILMGGVAVGMSPTMPGNPDLQAKPEVVSALIARIRGLEKQ